MKLDFSEIKADVVMEEGIADLTIVGAKEQVSANGTNMLVIDMNNEEGAFVRDHICLSGPGAFKAQMLFKALNLSEADIASMEASDFIGLSLRAEIIHEEYNDEIRAKTKKYIG